MMSREQQSKPSAVPQCRAISHNGLFSVLLSSRLASMSGVNAMLVAPMGINQRQDPAVMSVDMLEFLMNLIRVKFAVSAVQQARTWEAPSFAESYQKIVAMITK